VAVTTTIGVELKVSGQCRVFDVKSHAMMFYYVFHFQPGD